MMDWIFVGLLVALIITYTADALATLKLNKLKREFNDLLLEQNRLLKRIVFGEPEKGKMEDEIC